MYYIYIVSSTWVPGYSTVLDLVLGTGYWCVVVRLSSAVVACRLRTETQPVLALLTISTVKVSYDEFQNAAL